MRIVVSGTHASGKSTLISAFALRHPEYTVLGDTFEAIDETWDAPSPGMFAAQLRVAADRLGDGELGQDVLAERSPLDFLAYLHAWEELTGRPTRPDVRDDATRLVRATLSGIDLLVVLPLTQADDIPVGDDEHPELRAAMNVSLLDLVDDGDVVDESVTVIEITGDPARRLAALESTVDRLARRPGRGRDPRICPTCGDPLRFEILDDDRFLVAWSCVSCGLVRTTEPV